jgi:hypothetical protein
MVEVAGVVFVLGHVVRTVLLGVAFAAVGWAILHLSHDEWDLPPLT